MNKKQIKDLHSMLRSFELNSAVLKDIYSKVEMELFAIEERRDTYEDKGTDYWMDRADELEERISSLQEEITSLDSISEMLHDFIKNTKTEIGRIEGEVITTEVNAVLKPIPSTVIDRDSLFDEAARSVVNANIASTSSLQRRFSIGYNRATKIMDQLENAGIVGPSRDGKAREVLIDPNTLEDILSNQN